MGTRLRGRGPWLLGAAVLVVGIPVLAQSGGPESLLPPGFGDTPPPTATPSPASPATPGTTTPGAVPPPVLSNDASAALDAASDALPDDANAANAAADLAQKYDLPPTARRSLAQVGPLTVATGGLSPDAFGQARGPFLAGLMRASRAPFVSRWANVLLRRALLSGTRTPREIGGADWVAERAWLLLRMGEADAARMLVQSVDADRYTARLYAVAMQAQLATADPAGLCPLLPRARDFSDEPSWFMAQAICASFSADQGTASAVLNQASRRGVARGIDYRLAEKVVGSGPNSRRSVKIEWDNVPRLTSWRFGLATATNVEIPAALYESAGVQVRAWEARAPMVPLARRQAGVAAATRLGVFSGDAARTYWAQLVDDPDAPADIAAFGEQLRGAYAGDTIGERIAAMRAIWARPAADGGQIGPNGVNFALLPVIARAAAGIPPTNAAADDTPWLLAAMLSSGFDRNAARWARIVSGLRGEAGERAWALLATGSPDANVDLSASRIRQFTGADPSEAGETGQLLVAALGGLGRLPAGDAAALLADARIDPQPRSRWSRAILAAAQRREKGTVALLAAVGLQTRAWSALPPAHLYFIVAALRTVGLEPEARMIAAEAMARA